MHCHSMTAATASTYQYLLLACKTHEYPKHLQCRTFISYQHSTNYLCPFPWPFSSWVSRVPHCSSSTCARTDPLGISVVFFYGPDVFHVTQPTLSERNLKVLTSTSGLASYFLHPPTDSWQKRHCSLMPLPVETIIKNSQILSFSSRNKLLKVNTDIWWSWKWKPILSYQPHSYCKVSRYWLHVYTYYRSTNTFSCHLPGLVFWS